MIKGNNGTGKTTFANLLYSIEKNDISILDKLKRIDKNEDIDVEEENYDELLDNAIVAVIRI